MIVESASWPRSSEISVRPATISRFGHSGPRPVVRTIFSRRLWAPRVDEKRERAEDERRNEAQQSVLDEMREDGADHEGDEGRGGASSRFRDQYAEATENLEDTDDISNARWIS